MMVGGYFMVLFVAAAGVAVRDPVVLPQLAPNGQVGDLSVLWQVQTALVAVALPFLFVLTPLVRNEELAVMRTAELLMADTFIVPILIFALGGVLWIGAVALWLDHEVATWMASLLVLVPTVVGIAFAYWRSARIVADPAYVREASRPLLLSRLDESVVEQASFEYANGSLHDHLEPLNLSVSLFPPRDESEWIHFKSASSGVLSEVHAGMLSSWFKTIPRARAVIRPPVSKPSRNQDPEQMEYRPPATASDRIVGHWTRLIGDRLSSETTIVALRRSEFEPFDERSAEDAFQACIEVRYGA